MSQKEIDVLDFILEKLNTINFREAAKIEEKGNLGIKQYRICTIKELINKAKEAGCQFMVDNSCPNVYNGKFWEVIEKDRMTNFLSKAATRIGVNEIEAECFKFVKDLLSQFMISADIRKEFDERKVCVNLKNGTFVVTEKGHGLREFKADDYLKYQLDFEYNPSNTCPMFIKFLNEVLPDENAQKGLAEFIASVFVPWLKIEKTVLLYGSGANGKSVVYEIVCALLGKNNICTYSLENLTDNKGYQRANLADKLLNYATEITGERISSGVFKQLVSGEEVEARQIYGYPFMMKDYAKMMFNCNVLPRNAELTDGYFRRFYIIPFLQTIPVEKRDPNLPRKIISSELSGIFNWVLEGLDRILKQNNLTESALVKDMIEQYRVESDSVALFIEDESYTKSVESHIPLKDIRGEYVNYCKINGYTACSNIVLSSRLKALGFEVKRNSSGNQVYMKK